MKYSLTNPQNSIWLTEKFFSNTSVNNISGYTLINQKVNFDVLKDSINEVIKTNDSMRLKFKEENDSCFQYIEDYVPFNISTLELSSEKDVKNKALELAKIPFNIENNYLFRFVIFKLPNNFGGYFFTAHHLIGDSWGLGLIVRQIANIYSSKLNNSFNAQTNPSYLNYIKNEQEYLSSNKFNIDKEYWDKLFHTVPEVASIPSFKKVSSINNTCDGNRLNFNISEDNVKKINNFCKENKISLYNFFMAIYSLYISRVSNLDDFVMGTPILNRTNFEQKHTTGMFISTAPLRININNELSFIDFSKEISINTFSLFRHQKYPYQCILENLRKTDSSIPNLYNVVLSYQITKTFDDDTGIDYKSEWVSNGCCADDLQIHLFDINDENSITVAYDYKISKYDESDISSLHNRILTVIDQIINNNNILLKDIEIVTPEEKHKILYEFNNTYADYPRDKTIVDLFEEQVEKTPDNIAVVFESQRLTYRELNEKANQLARYMIDNGVKNGDIIGILLDKSIELIVSILSTLKTGSAFLPLDITYPNDRINYMIENSNPKLILTSYDFVGKTIDCKIKPICINLNNLTKYKKDNLNLKCNACDLAYIMYTSGSTGSPKGVMVKNQNIIRLVKNNNFINFSKTEHILQTGSIVFDACTFEIWSALLNGFELYIIKKDDLLNPSSLEKYINNNQITILWLTAPLFNELSESNPYMFKNVRTLLTGGDVLSTIHINKVKHACPNLTIINGYGPTENTTFSCCFTIDKEYTSSIPIGKPISNSTAYIVSKHGSLLPIGIPGELWVGGDGVSNGYLNNQKLTKEKFIKNPFGKGIIYKTGDLVNWLHDGNINFIGRIDNQVKVRGFRIELSEIDEQIIKLNPSIKQSFTTIKEYQGIKFILSYIISSTNINTENLKDNLKKTLPAYMIPSFIISIDKLPLNVNGKIDKKALPTPNITSNKDIVSRNNLDSIIINCLKKLLILNEISISDSFFDLGGDSLSAISFANILSNKLNQSITVKDIFDYPIIKDLSDYISELTDKKENKITVQSKKAYYPASSAQKRIYYSCSLDNNSTLYNIAGGLILDNQLNIQKLETCFKELINRHDSLRTHFDIKNEEIVQIIDDNIDFNLEINNVSTDNVNKIYTEFVKPFDLSKAPLFRVNISKLKNGKMLLLLDMHHIISDGTSLNILLNELCTLYNNGTLPDKHINYKDFAIWEQKQLETEKLNASKEYWITQFNNEIPLLNMPTTYSRQSVQSFEGSNYYTKLSKDQFDKINKLSKNLNITPYMLMLSCYYILLSKYTSQDDIVVGSPIIGRELPELSNLLGMFVNSLPLKNTVNNNLSFNEFVNEIKTNCLLAFKNQSYPFDELVKALNIKRDTSRNPLFDTMFVFQNDGYPKVNFDGINAQYFIPNNNISKFDLTLEILPINNEYSMRFEYCTKLFDEDFIKRLSSHYINILDSILNKTDIKISNIDMLLEDEKNQILYDFNNTKVNYQKNKSIIDLFEEQVQKTPNNIAVVFENQKLTYRELNEKANQLANYLIKQNVSKNSIIGIMLSRSIEIIIAILGILKTGSAYLPIDPTFPKNRIKYILKDSKVNTLLIKNNLFETTDLNLIDININNSTIYNSKNIGNLNINISPSDLAYVIYTSGSTGNPKGVTISHQNVNNFTNGISKQIKFSNVIVSVTTMCFDIFVLESILPLQHGLTIVIANESEQTIPALLDNLCVTNNVKMLQTTPSKLSLLMSDPESLNYLKNLDTLMLGGEPLPINLLEQIKNISHCKVFNMYGPTETTVWSSIKDLTKQNTITVGKPIANTTAYVLDSNLNVLPVGISGNLYLGGDGVSNGYLNKPDLTDEKFIENPYVSGEKIYNTGDLAKWLPNGELVCLGRSDFQVKIRGLRIELEEIEKVILTFPNINNVVVNVNIDSLNRQILCAYFISNERISLSELKEYMRNLLPSYMIPTYITQLSAFTYTPNGKIDKKALPIPDFQNNKSSITLPKSTIEQKLLSIWEKLLCISPISTTDNFFDIGGDSLLALKLQMELIKADINITYAEIFKYNTIKKLGNLIDKKIENPNIENIYEKSYDFSSINKLLSYNNTNSLSKISYTQLGNVLLTGVTGFLGSHILDYLLKNTNVKIYCLVRKDPSISLKDKVLNKLHFYFGENYDNLLNKRFFIINSDLSCNNLGLTDEKLLSLSNNISCVINSAAIVKHYGDYSDFEKINVTSVKQLINFCKKYKKQLIQISTISVSGNTLMDLANNPDGFDKNVNFAETNLYIGQSLDNVYVRSKFEAEKAILEEVNKNTLNALILRVGNITNRWEDGKFQSNPNENAFANKLKAFIKLGYIPDYILDKYIEFSPVDKVSEAIIKSIENYSNSISVLHIYNHNHIFIKDFMKLLPEKYSLKIVSDTEFKEIINKSIVNDDKKYIISNLINDLDHNNKLVYDTHINIKSEFSQDFLKKSNFKWPIITKHYINKLLKNI